jgi:hypothetical protein
MLTILIIASLALVAELTREEAVEAHQAANVLEI